jgi:tRNA(adenine34) deaminase
MTDFDRGMRRALAQARYAIEAGEIPVGAALYADGQLIAQAHNLTERLQDATAHAEILCITAGAHALGSKYLKECTLFVTLEPCVMCAGALKWAQIGTVVYAAADPKAGFSTLAPPEKIFHPKTRIVAGILKDEAAALLTQFFRCKRNSSHHRPCVP